MAQILHAILNLPPIRESPVRHQESLWYYHIGL
jgi:hypothetical protein